MTTQLKELLEEFKSYSNGQYELVLKGSNPSLYTVIFGSMVHGNEYGSLPGILRFLREAKNHKFTGTLKFLIGNPEAGLQDVRFLEQDLNRVFSKDAPDSMEKTRAFEIMPFLEGVDLMVDFHQTIEACSQAFYIFPWNETAWHWVRAIGAADNWVTRSPSASFAGKGQKGIDEYIRDAGVPAFTVELTQKGFNTEAEQKTYDAVLKTISLCENHLSGKETIDVAAAKKPDLKFYVSAFSQEFKEASYSLKEGLSNFLEVKKGDVLSQPGTPEMVAPMDGALLFPKYPKRDEDGKAISPFPTEIYKIVKVLEEAHPKDHFKE